MEADMAWMSTALALTAIFLVSLQGISFLSRSPRTNYTKLGGTLGLFLAVGGLIAFFLFRAGALIASPEYGVLMVQGTAALVWACLLLVGIAVGGGIISQIVLLSRHADRPAGEANEGKKWPSHRVYILFLGLVVGVAAAFQFQSLNPSDPTPFCIRFYDMWWPPLMVWLMVCLSQWIATTIWVRAPLFRFLWALFCVTGIAFVPVSHSNGGFHYGNPSSELLWKAVVILGVPLFMALSPLVFMKSESGPYRGAWRVRVAISGLSGGAGLASALYWTNPSESPLPWFLRPWVFWLAWTLVFTGWTLVRLHLGSFKVPVLSPRGRAGDAVAGIAVLTIAWSIADLTHFIQLDPAWDLAILISSWIVLLEMIAGARIIDLQGAAHATVENAKERLRQARDGARTRTAKTVSTWRRILRVKSGAVLVARLIMVAVVLIAADEIPSAGKMIVHPFSVAGLPAKDNPREATPTATPSQNANNNGDDKEKEKNRYLGHLLADRIANTLALFGQELRPDVLVTVSSKFSHSDNGDPKRSWVPATSEESDGLEAAAKNSNVSVSGVNVSLEFLTAPIQAPMRRLLGIRTIRGSVQSEGKGNKHVLLASSSNGQTWRVPSELFGSPGKASLSGCSAASQPPKPLAEDLRLADMLAYQIISTDPTLVKRGGPSSWKALRPFHEGMVAWRSFELTTDYAALTTSIAKFRETVCEDSGFAMAQYRLARALTADGQPGAAVTAYRASLQAYPDFVAGHIALAGTLFDFDEYCYYSPPAVFGGKNAPNESETAGPASDCRPGHGGTPGKDDPTTRRRLGRQNEATGLWRRVIYELRGEASVSDQAAAYAGLCHGTMELQKPEDESSQPKDQDKDRDRRYAAFFFCKRAEYLYSKLPPSLSADGQVKAARASALDEIGEILNTTPVGKNARIAPDNEKWSCRIAESDIGETKYPTPYPPYAHTLYTPYAVKYYQKALAVLPEDWEARCYVAVDSLLSAGNERPMRDLYADAAMHLKRGDLLWGIANRQTRWEIYKQAIDEYKMAIDLAPADTDAMNDYANAFWYWRVRFPEHPPSDKVAQQAEQLARLANAMTKAADPTARLHDPATGTMSHLIDAATLLEVFLGEARADKALKVLPKREAALPNHAYFNDVRWDLAQAYLCAAADARQAGAAVHQISDSQGRAQALFQQIRELEKTRETRPFTDAPKTLNDKACFLRQPVGLERSPKRVLLRAHHTEKDPRGTQSLRQVAEGWRESR
jgi:tetratricopeptide (TPR) repeat protein